MVYRSHKKETRDKIPCILFEVSATKEKKKEIRCLEKIIVRTLEKFCTAKAAEISGHVYGDSGRTLVVIIPDVKRCMQRKSTLRLCNRKGEVCIPKKDTCITEDACYQKRKKSTFKKVSDLCMKFLHEKRKANL